MKTTVVIAKNDILDVLLSPDDVDNNFDNAITSNDINFQLKPRPSKQCRPDSASTSRREEEEKEVASSPTSTDVDVDANAMNRFDHLSFLWMTPRERIVSSTPILPPRLNLPHKIERGEVLCNQHVHMNVAASAPSFPHLRDLQKPR